MDYPQPNSLNNFLPTSQPLVCPEDALIFQKLLEKDLSPNSKKAIVSDLKHFLKWYVAMYQEQFKFSRLTESDLIAYKNWSMKGRQHKPSTINRRIVTLRSLCKLAVSEGRLKTNLAENVKQLTLQALAPKSLDSTELRRFLKEVELRGSLRDQLIVQIMVGAGLRVSELANLKVQDVHISERKGHVIIRNGKGGKTRTVPLNQRIRDLMQKYLEQQKPADSVFMGQRGALKTIAFNKIVDGYAKKAGINCHPHQLRHNFSFHFLLQSQNDIVALAEILGHSDIKVTARYSQNRLSDLQEKVERMSY